ncbi:13181_t:CDS:2, partial [Ambispora leptoticha]
MDYSRENSRGNRRNDEEDRRRDNRRPRERGREHEQQDLDQTPEKLRFIVIELVMPSVRELPMSSSIYATLVGLINVGKSDIAKAIVTETSEILQQNLNVGDWREVKLTLKFFAELTNANVIQPETLLKIYGNLLSVLDEPVIKKRRADTFIKIVLSTLPYIGKRLKDREPTKFEQMLNKIQSYFNARTQQSQFG